MSEPSQRPPIAAAPISLLLFAHALSTETAEAMRAWRQYLDTLKRPYEILLIQETRPDVIAAAPDADLAAVRRFTYERAVGWSAALNDAIRAAQHPLLAFCTADTQYVPGDLGHMLKVPDNPERGIDKVDMVVGYRAGGQAPLWRVLLDLFGNIFGRVVLGMAPGQRVSWLGSEGRGRRWVARWIFGVRVLDPECPFRLARREIFAHLPIQSNGSFAQFEILAKANHLTCLFAEEPVTWTRPATPVSDAISFGADALRVFRDADFGPFVKPLAIADAT